MSHRGRAHHVEIATAVGQILASDVIDPLSILELAPHKHPVHWVSLLLLGIAVPDSRECVSSGAEIPLVLGEPLVVLIIDLCGRVCGFRA
jgi:hypothetical protein